MKVKLVDGMPIAYYDDGSVQMLDTHSEEFRDWFGYVVRRYPDGSM